MTTATNTNTNTNTTNTNTSNMSNSNSIKIHVFRSSGAAYDACQCDESVKSGDLLIIPREQVTGIADTWPVAVSAKFGKLHQLAESVTFAEYIERLDAQFHTPANKAKWLAAVELARNVNFSNFAGSIGIHEVESYS